MAIEADWSTVIYPYNKTLANHEKDSDTSIEIDTDVHEI